MRIHIVQKGDTLFEIAKQYGVDFEKLVNLNSHLSSPDMIMPGMKIKIPSESKQVRSGTGTDKDKRISAVRDEQKVDKERRVEPIRQDLVEKEKRVEPIQRKPEEKQKREVEVKPSEKPIQKEVREEMPIPKKVEVPKQTRPIMEKPKMPKKVKLEDIRDEVKEYEDTMPERKILYKRELREPVQEQQMEYQYPIQQPMMYKCCCCSCCHCRRRPPCHCSSRNYPHPSYYPYHGNMPYNPMY